MSSAGRLWVRAAHRRGEQLRAALDPSTAPRSLHVEPAHAAELVAAAHYHRVDGYVLRALAPGCAPDDVLATLGAEVSGSVARHMRSLADERRVRAALEPIGVGHLVVKGPVLAEHHHGGADLRSYRDLDLLVHGSDLRTAVAALTGLGWGLVDRNWEFLAEVLAGEVHLTSSLGTAVDLHWQLLFRASLRREIPVDADAMMARSRVVRVAGAPMRTLDPVDTVLHLCLHAAQSGGHRLIWLKDVERAIAVDQPDWDVLVQRARHYGLGPISALVLRRSRAALGADVPAAVLRDLSGSRSLSAAMAVADAVTPAERATSRGSPARLLAKSMRGSAAATRREIWSRVRAAGPHTLRLLRRPGARPDQGADLLRGECDDTAGQELFLEAVSAASRASTG
jgi:Uncharacterised nucleotidyltransferase